MSRVLENQSNVYEIGSKAWSFLQVKAHPFFSGVDWENLALQKVRTMDVCSYHSNGYWISAYDLCFYLFKWLLHRCICFHIWNLDFSACFVVGYYILHLLTTNPLLRWLVMLSTLVGSENNFSPHPFSFHF